MIEIWSFLHSFSYWANSYLLINFTIDPLLPHVAHIHTAINYCLGQTCYEVNHHVSPWFCLQQIKHLPSPTPHMALSWFSPPLLSCYLINIFPKIKYPDIVASVKSIMKSLFPIKYLISISSLSINIFLNLHSLLQKRIWGRQEHKMYINVLFCPPTVKF